MKKIFATLILMATIVNTSPLFAGKCLGDAAWLEMRILHSKYLERPNNMTHDETEMWIAQNMNRWLENRQNNHISELERENKNLKKQIQEIYDIENNFNRYKIERNIAYSVIAIILALFIVFILIKKCQAKKLPKVIEDAINENM